MFWKICFGKFSQAYKFTRFVYLNKCLSNLLFTDLCFFPFLLFEPEKRNKEYENLSLSCTRPNSFMEYPSGHMILWRHRFFIGCSSWCSSITYWHWSDIVIWYIFPVSYWCCSNNVGQCKTSCYSDTNFQCRIDIR